MFLFPDSSVGKESTCNAGDPSLILGLGRSPGEGIGYPLQYSWASLVVQLVKNPPAMQETWVWSLGWEDPLENGKRQHSFFKSCLQQKANKQPQGAHMWKSWPVCDPSPWNSPGQNTGVGSHSLLQGIFQMQGSNPGLLHCRQLLHQLSHQGSSRILEWVAYSFSRGSSQPRNQTRVSCIVGIFFTRWATREAPKVKASDPM